MNKKNNIYSKYIKRFIDIMLSLVVILLCWWLFLIVALCVKVNIGSPIIFKQERPGKNGKIFNLYKFRSMSNAKDEKGEFLPDSQRLTKFGRVLRSTSLDEIPEIFNILKGDMSLVGPRPLLVKYLNDYNEYEKRRHDVRPGLTGLAQVSGRNSMTWKNRFKKDVEYVENVSFFLDFKIVLLTIKKVFIREGIEYKDNQTISEYFESKERIY